MKIGITKKKQWEIVQAKELGPNSGEARPDTRQIVLLENDKNKVSTLFHEMLHCASFDYDLNLTETQVRGIEKWFEKIHKRHSIIDVLSAFKNP